MNWSIILRDGLVALFIISAILFIIGILTGEIDISDFDIWDD